MHGHNNYFFWGLLMLALLSTHLSVFFLFVFFNILFLELIHWILNWKENTGLTKLCCQFGWLCWKWLVAVHSWMSLSLLWIHRRHSAFFSSTSHYVVFHFRLRIAGDKIGWDFQSLKPKDQEFLFLASSSGFMILVCTWAYLLVPEAKV